MPFQELLAYDILAYNDSGEWTHLKYGYEVSRRNGKSEAAIMRLLYAMKHDEHVLYTAHRSDTARAIWERCCDFATALKIKYKTYSSFGREGMAWSDPDAPEEEQQRKHFQIDFRTRNSAGAGLGSGYDVLIIDEAQEYTKDQESSLKYVVSASMNPQTLYFGTPPTAISRGNTFPEMRRKALAGEMPDTGWSEWSVYAMKDPHDTDAWYETNPALGYTLTERTVRAEITGDDLDFNIQRLGYWSPYSQAACITPGDWKAGMVDAVPKLKGKLFVGIKFGHDNLNTAVCIAVKTDTDRIFCEAYGCQPTRAGNEWILRLLQNADIDKAVTDGNGSDTLVEQCKVIKFRKITKPKVGEIIQANSDFENGIFSGTVLHMEQPSMDAIITSCEHRAIGTNGGYGFQSIDGEREIALVEAQALAYWACKSKAKQKQEIHY